MITLFILKIGKSQLIRPTEYLLTIGNENLVFEKLESQKLPGSWLG